MDGWMDGWVEREHAFFLFMLPNSPAGCAYRGGVRRCAYYVEFGAVYYYLEGRGRVGVRKDTRRAGGDTL